MTSTTPAPPEQQGPRRVLCEGSGAPLGGLGTCPRCGQGWRMRNYAPKHQVLIDGDPDVGE